MAVLSASKLKESIRQSFRKACIKRLEGQEAEAVKILQEELPALIKQWHEMEETAPAEIESLLAEELARTESAYWVVQATEERTKKNLQGVLTESQLEGILAVWNAKHQLELNALKTKLEGVLGELITYSGAEALGGRIAQELGERVRGAIADVVSAETGKLAQTSDVESALTHVQNSLSERIDVRIRMAEEQSARGTQAMEVVLAEVKATVAGGLQGLVTNEVFEARLMAATTMLHEAQNRALLEMALNVQNTLDKKLAEGLTPLQQRMGALMSFQDWERGEKESNQKILWQMSEQQAATQNVLVEKQAQGLAAMSAQQQNFLTGLQRDWELLHKNMDELRQRQGNLETDIKMVAAVVEEFRKEQIKTRESVSATLVLMTDQLRGMDEANRQLKLSLPQALQSFERQTENRLRDQAQLYQAEINALHRKLETGLTEAFGKKLKGLKIVAE